MITIKRIFTDVIKDKVGTKHKNVLGTDLSSCTLLAVKLYVATKKHAYYGQVSNLSSIYFQDHNGHLLSNQPVIFA